MFIDLLFFYIWNTLRRVSGKQGLDRVKLGWHKVFHSEKKCSKKLVDGKNVERSEFYDRNTIEIFSVFRELNLFQNLSKKSSFVADHLYSEF